MPLLELGATLEGEIEDSDPRVETPTLKSSYTDAPVVGKSYRIEIEEGGSCTIELRSYLFDAYLVLRDEAGNVLAEDDDDGIGVHARISTELELGVYLLEACALHGERGPFELELGKGKPTALSRAAQRTAERADLERAVAIRESTLGPEHPASATSIDNLARFLRAHGDYAAARPLYERALAIREKALGPEHPDTAQSLNNLAGWLWATGDAAAAEPLMRRALAINEEALGPEHPETAKSYNNLAVMLWAQGDYAGALPLYNRALAIREKVLGPEHPDTADSLGNLARVLQDQGDYSAARLLFERALAIDEKALGPMHPGTATDLNNLAVLLSDQGDDAAARPLYERALAITEEALGAMHPDTAQSLNNLAALLRGLGDPAAARPLYERALAIREKVLGPEHPGTAVSLNSLALLLEEQGDLAAARPLFERALKIFEKALGAHHPETANILNNLAVLLWARRDHAAAQPLCERALAVREEVLGPEHPATAQSLNNLAELLGEQGNHATARLLFERALAIVEKALGPEHPDTARSRYSLASLLADEGYESESWALACQTLESSLGHAQSTLWSLSEKERLLFLRKGDDHLRLVLSFAGRSTPTASEAASYQLLLAWGGLVSRTLLETRARLCSLLPEEAVSKIENLRGVQAQLSRLLYATDVPDRERQEREIRALRERRNELEVELQRVIGPTQERLVTLAELQAHLAPGSAFLDFLVHPLYRPAKREADKVVRKGEWSADHLSAWIVRSDRVLVHLDLGLAKDIEEASQAWLRTIVSDAPLVAARGIGASEGSDATTDGGRRLTALLWAPLAVHLDGVAHVFVRPDSFLGTLPLEVLPLEGGKYLIEEKGFVYVQTPNDLLKEAERSSISSLLTVGGVDFEKRAGLGEGVRAPAVASATLGDELRSGLGGSWPRLAYTESETRSVNESFEASSPEGARLLLSGDAPTEERLKEELPRYSVAHLATHGFFHPAGTVSMWDSAQAVAQEPEYLGVERERHALVGALPGLLTGLVCAGANEAAPAGRDDGLLTAEEVLWLDLSKVELVVLSACETALGERRAGEGMIGLRRAFGLAGAKTVVSSLWSVKDRSTSELMQRFYENLWRKKQGRAEALRNAQLEMLARNRASDNDALPSTWGAFVLSGEWR